MEDDDEDGDEVEVEGAMEGVLNKMEESCDFEGSELEGCVDGGGAVEGFTVDETGLGLDELCGSVEMREGKVR